MRILFAALLGLSVAGATFADHKFFTVQERLDVLGRATVWEERDIAAADVRTGPAGPGGFEPEQWVECTFASRPDNGHSPKFNCTPLGSDEHLKVKYGRENSEVYGEVAATRLFWLLGFYADRMYPVRVRCQKCPPDLRDPDAPRGTTGTRDQTIEFPIAAIERPMKGREVELEHRKGWDWGELNIAHGSPRAQRDALKLLAVMLQHTDNKSEQQRLLCVGPGDGCERSVAMINDLGLTFGRASLYNRSSVSGVNLDAWASTPVWKGKTGCVGNLPRSYTGSLENPVISDEGRAFLAERLAAVSDAQLHDLFALARFDQRSKQPIDAWIAAFKAKRDAIAARRCDN